MCLYTLTCGTHAVDVLHGTGVLKPTTVSLPWEANDGLLAMGADVARRTGYSDYICAAVAMDCHWPGPGGQVEISRDVHGTQVPQAPVQGALVLLASHRGNVAD